MEICALGKYSKRRKFASNIQGGIMPGYRVSLTSNTAAICRVDGRDKKTCFGLTRVVQGEGGLDKQVPTYSTSCKRPIY
jgi:hypothetical protein